MNENKKSFILYYDLLHTVNQLPNDKAGELFKHILEYVNGLDPETDDLITKISFEPIKQSLKRNSEKYESIRLKNVENANKRWAKNNATASDRMPNDAKDADSVSVSVSDSVNDNVSDNVINKNIIKKFDFKASLIEHGTSPQIADEFMQVRKAKKAINTETAFKALLREVHASKKDFGYIIQLCVESSWSGFKNAYLQNLNANQPKKIAADEKKAIVPSFRIIN